MDLPSTPSFRLDGKRALVAGAAGGIGLGCAAALAEAGAHTICAGRTIEPLNDIVAEMTKRGMSAEALRLDISEIDKTREDLATLPAFDIVVNSAGLARHSAALDTNPDDYDAVMAVNVRGAYFLSTTTARQMIEQGVPGSIIQISSQMGQVGGIDRAVYCASKHALEGMTKSMAIEWGPHNIRVNNVGPTFIKTPLTETTFANPERVAWIKSKIKVDRIGEIKDIMGAVLFLASDASALVTGTTLLVDGGWTAD